MLSDTAQFRSNCQQHYHHHDRLDFVVDAQVSLYLHVARWHRFQHLYRRIPIKMESGSDHSNAPGRSPRRCYDRFPAISLGNVARIAPFLRGPESVCSGIPYHLDVFLPTRRSVSVDCEDDQRLDYPAEVVDVDGRAQTASEAALSNSESPISYCWSNLTAYLEYVQIWSMRHGSTVEDRSGTTRRRLPHR